MGKENNRIAGDINCLRSHEMPATLISTQGSHCEVWETAGTFIRQKIRHSLDVVIKIPLSAHSTREVQVLNREYQTLKTALDDIVPDALFIRCRVKGAENLIVIAETVSPWFNLAYPGNEQEALNLLQCLPKARVQLGAFLDAAERWHSQDGKVIDLFGVDNLVLDKKQNVRYLDSFGAFFYEDLLYILDEPDPELSQQIEISIRRRKYLRCLLKEAEKRLCHETAQGGKTK